jgi:phospholipase/carboxylesterase
MQSPLRGIQGTRNSSMNRLPTLPATVVEPTFRTSTVTPKRVASETLLPIEFPHRLFLPTNFVPTYDYPLVVWLHSQGSSEFEVDTVMESLSDQNYLAVAPRANRRQDKKRRVYQWGESLVDFAFAEDAVWECIDAAIEMLPVNPTRIFLAGFGQGGTIAQWIGWQYPEHIAGVVSLSGPMPEMRGCLSQWKSARDLPVLFSHRKGSTICSEQDLQYAIRTAHRASLPYRFWQLRSEADSFAEADELSTEMLAAANRFMMGIVTDTPISLQAEASRDHLVGPFGIN